MFLEMSAYFVKVIDRQGKPVRRLWKRNGKFYAQITLKGLTKRVPLQADTQEEAVIQLGELLNTRLNGTSHMVPTFEAIATNYDRQIGTTKRSTTIQAERSAIKQWKALFGPKLVSEITVGDILEWRAKKLERSVGRTVNLYITILMNVLGYAKSLGYLDELPKVAPVKYSTPRKILLTVEDINTVCHSAPDICPLIRFLAYSGARISEALRLEWSDVDFEKKTVALGVHGSKNGEVRQVDMNAQLFDQLNGMVFTAKTGQVFEWRCQKRALRALKKAAKECNLPHIDGFHLFRHFFASKCVMSGVDFLVVSRWLGHKDGGILLGRIYGHLNNEHTAKMAGKVTDL